MTINMHHMVRGAIRRINPDVPGTIYVSTGHTMEYGISTPSFVAVPAQLQMQALTHESLYYLNGLQESKALSVVYAYGSFTNVNRPSGSGGDLVNINGQWWAIHKLLEGWDNVFSPEWCSFTVTEQLNAATLDALLAQLKNGNVPTVGP